MTTTKFVTTKFVVRKNRKMTKQSKQVSMIIATHHNTHLKGARVIRRSSLFFAPTTFFSSTGPFCRRLERQEPDAMADAAAARRSQRRATVNPMALLGAVAASAPANSSTTVAKAAALGGRGAESRSLRRSSRQGQVANVALRFVAGHADPTALLVDVRVCVCGGCGWCGWL